MHLLGSVLSDREGSFDNDDVDIRVSQCAL